MTDKPEPPLVTWQPPKRSRWDPLAIVMGACVVAGAACMVLVLVFGGHR